MKRFSLLAIMTSSLIILLAFFTTTRDTDALRKPAASHKTKALSDANADMTSQKLAPEILVPTVNSNVLPKTARDRKVLAKLQHFLDKTAEITPESVAEERERISEGLKEALSKKTAMPQIRPKTDATGHAWEELDFGDGVIRYLPAIEPQTNL